MNESLQLYALDSEYKVLQILKPTNIQWNREYYEYGTFSIQLPIKQYSDKMRYIFTNQRPELGAVSQIRYKTEKNGFAYVQVSGHFDEVVLNDKIVDKQFIGKGNVEDEICRFVNAYKKDIPLLEVAPSKHMGTPTDFESFGEELGKKAKTILRLHQMSHRITYDYEQNKKTFEVWQGVDRTESQKENNFVKFSTSFKNLTEPDVFTDTTDYKNFCIVKGSINDTPVYVNSDLSDGGYKKETFIESQISYEAETMTEDSYKELLRLEGIQYLIENHSVINNVEFNAEETSYKYMVDVDLGDKCDIIIAELGILLEARIISVHEVFKNGLHELSFEFGNKIVKKARK